MKTKKIIKLTPPKISINNIKEKITCIRAHRERIFNVSCEIINNKLVIHNYGQGGAGWTFLFGCVNQSVRELERKLKQKLKTNPEFNNKNISVIGAGCYGLLTAIILTLRGYSVEIFAKETETISSNKAAGFFFPRARKCSTDAEREIFKSMGLESYRTYLEIIDGKHPFIKSGPKILPAYFGPDIDPGFAPYIEKNLVNKPEEVLIDFGNGKVYDAIQYNTVFVNSAGIMQELHRNIKELNIKITKQEINNFSDIKDQIIFNCSGLGAKELANDKRIIPVQGHLIALKNQPDISQLQYMINFKVTQLNPSGRPRDELIYFAPKESGILGITFIRGQDSLVANQQEFDRLLQRSQDFFGFFGVSL